MASRPLKGVKFREGRGGGTKPIYAFLAVTLGVSTHDIKQPQELGTLKCVAALAMLGMRMVAQIHVCQAFLRVLLNCHRDRGACLLPG